MPDEEPDEREVVNVAAEAAESVVFSRYERSQVRDLDVTVTFEQGQLEVDVYIDVTDETTDPEQVAEDAVLAARSAVDDLFE